MANIWHGRKRELTIILRNRVAAYNFNNINNTSVTFLFDYLLVGLFCWVWFFFCFIVWVHSVEFGWTAGWNSWSTVRMDSLKSRLHNFLFGFYWRKKKGRKYGRRTSQCSNSFRLLLHGRHSHICCENLFRSSWLQLEKRFGSLEEMREIN